MRKKNEQGLSRRGFLAAGAVGLSAAALGAAGPQSGANCIFLMLVGGPSQLDTFDPKPDAPSGVRGPFKPIRTNVAGISLGEHLPLMAKRADKFAIVRSLNHDAAPIHETGCQMMQTGHLFRAGVEQPHLGAVLSAAKGRRGSAPTFAVLPGPIGSTGVTISHGQGAAHLGASHEPVFVKPTTAEARYGSTPFGDSCMTACRLVERGTRFVTVNMFDSVFNETTWDCHADGGSLASSLDDYRETLCPMFDAAYSALLDDLSERGLLETTLVVAAGEFGRTPHMNGRGGRDHWPGAWSVLFAGGGIRGGQVVGSTDRLGGEPKDRPVTPAMFADTIRKAVGLPHDEAVEELFV